MQYAERQADKEVLNMLDYAVCSGDDWVVERRSSGLPMLLGAEAAFDKGESFLHCLPDRQWVDSVLCSAEREVVSLTCYGVVGPLRLVWVWVDDLMKRRMVTVTRGEELSEESELRSYELNALLDSLYDGIWVIDRFGITVRVNKAMERIAGIKASDVTGLHVSAAVEKGYTDTVVTLKAMEARQPVTMFDVYPNGTRCLNTSTPILDSNGEIWRVIACIRDMTEIEDLQKRLLRYEWEAQAYREERGGKVGAPPDIVAGGGPPDLRQEFDKAASVNHPVLLLGETGTGKTFAASRIHELSCRRDKPFVPVNCGAIPQDLLEAELFGYEGGAFTGARQAGKLGMIDLAQGGTLFLDEIAELPLAMQVKLLHLLDGSGYRRVGGREQIVPDIRVIAATNHTLDALLHSGNFRRDLYFRLCGFVITLPSLRGRPDEIRFWAHFFAARAQEGVEAQHRQLSPGVLDTLCKHAWPGNLRELKTCIELMLELSEDDIIGPDCLPQSIRSNEQREGAGAVALADAVASVERQLIMSSLARTNSTYKTARELGVSQATIARKAKKYKEMKNFIEHKYLY